MPRARSFDDFDELCETLAGWDLDLRQLDRGRFSGELLQWGSRDAFLSYARFERVLQQRGSPLPGTWTFCLPQPDCRPFLWHGQQVAADDLVVLPPGWELDVVSYGGFEIATLSVAEESLARIAEREELSMRDLQAGGGRVVGSSGSLQRGLREVLDGTPAPGWIGTALPAQVLRSLSRTPQRSGKVPSALRRRVLDRALNHIEERVGDPVTVEQLCELTGASLRTLRRAFHERFEVSPKAYLRAVRLNGTLKLLRRGSPDSMRVADAANRFGFWHMGKFAADYRRQFGELPSETLAGR